MTGDDLRTIFLGKTLFRLETVLASRLVPILYFAGLAGILLWSITHLFSTFGRTFGDGLWGLLEIVVFGILGLVALRLACEVLLIFFKAHESAARAVNLSRVSGALVDEVREAISEIADEEGAVIEDDPSTAKRPSPRRTARRAPPSSPQT